MQDQDVPYIKLLSPLTLHKSQAHPSKYLGSIDILSLYVNFES